MKAKNRLFGKQQSITSVSLSFRPKTPRRLSAFEKVINKKDCDALENFLQENPQEDDDLWKKASFPLRKGCSDDFVLILLDRIQEPSNYDASSYLSDLAYWNFPKCARLVLDKFPVDINFKHRFRGSALTCAVRQESTEIATMLLDMPNVDINVKCINGRNPVWYAACNKDGALLQKLLDMGADSLQRDAEDTLPEQRTSEELAAQIRNTQNFGLTDLKLSIN
jgi:ankyrin repeat protein